MLEQEHISLHFEARAMWKAKRCTKCGLVKYAADFHIMLSSKDGRYAYCRSCALKTGRAHAAKVKMGLKDTEPRVCRVCHIEYPINEFYSGIVRGYDTRCRKCSSRYVLNWLDGDPQRKSDYRLKTKLRQQKYIAERGDVWKRSVLQRKRWSRKMCEEVSHSYVKTVIRNRLRRKLGSAILGKLIPEEYVTIFKRVIVATRNIDKRKEQLVMAAKNIKTITAKESLRMLSESIAKLDTEEDVDLKRLETKRRHLGTASSIAGKLLTNAVATKRHGDLDLDYYK